MRVSELASWVRRVGGAVVAVHAAEMLGVSKVRVGQLVQAGRLDSVRVGSVVYVSLSSISDYVPRPGGRPVVDR